MTAQESCKKILTGKVTIIAGGASGIGEITARRFAEHGARAVIIADIQNEKGQNVSVSIGSDVCTYVRCDVSDENQVKALVESTVELYGRLDVMFNNAGIVGEYGKNIIDLDLSDFDEVMAVNARGMVACAKCAARAMAEGGIRGSIVCIASTVASHGSDSYTRYTMSKHAVLGLVSSQKMAAMLVWVFHTPLMFMAVAENVGGMSLPPTDYVVDWIPKSNLQTWSLTTKFYVGDTLVFRYNKTKGIDVQEVRLLGFIECKTDDPIWTDGDGETLVQLRLPGPMYFIPSNQHYCEKGLKLQVMVVTNQSVPSASGSSHVGDFVKATWKQPLGKVTILFALIGALSAARVAILVVRLACKWNCFNNCCNYASFNLHQDEPEPPAASTDQPRPCFQQLAQPNSNNWRITAHSG